MKGKRRAIGLITISLALGIWLFSADRVHAKEPLIIVLDPGHGGENLGGEYPPYQEKDLTIVVASAMKEELEKFEGVEVYLTRESDVEMSLEERALFAAQKQADFLFCLHFNMSVEHNLYGAEVWVPAAGEFYSRGYSFAEIEMQELTDLGLTSRGIKTRLNKRDENYYGILRHCTEEGIPSVLIEHCHLDNANDQGFYQQGRTQLEEFGRLDARAVAKYFHLKSDILEVDYTNYQVSEIPVPGRIIRPDQTAPEYCIVRVGEIDPENGELTVEAEAADSDSYILYYSYSLDGGNSWSQLFPWPRPQIWNQSADTHSFVVPVPFEQPLSLLVRAHNGFDLWSQSEAITLEPIPAPKIPEQESEQMQEETQTEYDGNEKDTEPGIQENAESKKALSERGESEEKAYILNNTVIFLLIILIIVCMGIVVFILVRTIQVAANSRRR